MVGATEFESAASRSQTAHSSKLSYAPKKQGKICLFLLSLEQNYYTTICCFCLKWLREWNSNPRPCGYGGDFEIWTQIFFHSVYIFRVENMLHYTKPLQPHALPTELSPNIYKSLFNLLQIYNQKIKVLLLRAFL